MLASVDSLDAQTPVVTGSTPAAALFRLTTKTIGQDEAWSDRELRGGWRIQQHLTRVETYRLLDPQDHRVALGSWTDCAAELARRDDRTTPDVREEIVVLLHGLLRSADSMRPLAEQLAKLGWDTECFSYPSTIASVEEHARSLQIVLDHFPPRHKIHFVGHSLGNLVVRACLQGQMEKNGALDARIGRFVMIAPPNQGAGIARLFEDNALFTLFAGRSGKQLATQWDQLRERLLIPPCEFGILAGNQGYNPLLGEENDLIVAVRETRLTGAADFKVLPYNHGSLRTATESVRCIDRFLRDGYFFDSCQATPLLPSDQP